MQLERDNHVSSSIEDLENLFETEKVALLFLKAQSNTLIDGYLKLLDYELYVNLFISSDSNFKLSFLSARRALLYLLFFFLFLHFPTISTFKGQIRGTCQYVPLSPLDPS